MFILDAIRETPHLTLHRLKDLLEERGVTVSHDTVWRFLRHEGLSFKKTLFATEQWRSDVLRRRLRWQKVAPHLDPSRLVFIDETWIKTDMAPEYGWGAKGARVIGRKPDGRWQTLTFLAALRVHALTEPCVVNGPINGEIFLEYVRQFLAPSLGRGDVVILDNLGSHKSHAVRAAVLDTGAKLAFLPPYSPDLNPIEQVFAKVKHWLRMAQARSIEALNTVLGTLVSSIPAHECANYIENAGYVSEKT